MGMTVALWTDYGLTESLLHERMYPRIYPLAEQMW
ncbi:MAG: family 20 glycosylhydrolase [Bacteroidaceae bacterium]|nr:family 20 glycosylhydrolase [Bacteroidaceae bacterium]